MNRTAGSSSSSTGKLGWSELPDDQKEYFVRQVRRTFQQALQRVAPYRRFGPDWEGGMDRSLRRRRPAWEKIARYIYECGITDDAELFRMCCFIMSSMAASDRFWASMVPKLVDEYLSWKEQVIEKRQADMLASLSRLEWIAALPASQMAIEIGQIGHPAVRMAAFEVIGLDPDPELVVEATSSVEEEGINYTALRDKVRRVISGNDDQRSLPEVGGQEEKKEG